MHRASKDNYIINNVNFEKHCDKNERDNIQKLTLNECRTLQRLPNDWTESKAYK